MKRLAACLTGLLLALPLAAMAQKSDVRAETHPADAVFKRWDADGNGVLSREEFRKGWQARNEQLALNRLRSQFDRVDANKDGALDTTEYGNLILVRRAGDKAPPLSRFDANKDGKLQFDEYLVMVRQMAPQPATRPATGGPSR